MLNILKYIRGLNFTENPDYIYIKSLLKDAFIENGFIYDLAFDWVIQEISHSKNHSFVTESPQFK